MGLIALLASVFHLGRPLLAYRAVLGLRHSWLSREILAFGMFAGFAVAYAVAVHAMPHSRLITADVVRVLAWLVVAAGLSGIACSAMIYIFTQRDFWSPLQTSVKFTLTTALLGVASVWLTMLLMAGLLESPETTAVVQRVGRSASLLLVSLCTAKLVWEALLLRHLLSRKMTSLKRSALLMTRELSNVSLMRFAAGLLGGLVMPTVLMNSSTSAGVVGSPKFLVAATLLVIACLAGELLERYLFFAAVAAPRMPGGIR